MTELELLKNQLAALTARAEIEELMARFARLLSRGQGERIPGELFSARDDASVEFGASGPYIGRKKLATFFEKDALPGRFSMLLLTNPSVELSGERARGMWDALGLDLDAGDLGPITSGDETIRALLTSRTADGARYRAEWTVQRLQAELSREDGAWRIVHLRILDYLRSPMTSDPVAFSRARWQTDGIRLDAAFTSNRPFAEGELPENLAMGPTTYHWQYRPDALPPEV